MAAARVRAPDLLIIGDHLEEGDTDLEVYENIAGPFKINQIGDALLSLGPQKASGRHTGSPGTARAELHEPE